MSVTLFSGIGGDLRLLEAFLAHYRGLGVGRIYLCLHLKREDRATVDFVEAVGKRFDARLESIWVDTGLNHQRRYVERRAMIKRCCATSDWALLADLDEFQCYEAGLQAAVEHCEQTSRDYVLGRLVDRIAGDGGFPELDPGRLWRQFPLECRLTRGLLGGDDGKVGLFRAWVDVGPGHHAVLPACAASACPPDEVFAEFHHFKWDSTVVPRLRERRDAIRNEGWDWWKESDAFLTYLDARGGKLHLADEVLAARRSG